MLKRSTYKGVDDVLNNVLNADCRDFQYFVRGFLGISFHGRLYLLTGVCCGIRMKKLRANKGYITSSNKGKIAAISASALQKKKLKYSVFHIK